MQDEFIRRDVFRLGYLEGFRRVMGFEEGLSLDSNRWEGILSRLDSWVITYVDHLPAVFVCEYISLRLHDNKLLTPVCERSQ